MSAIKSAYELAQERLGGPIAKLTTAQKKELAEIDKVYAAKLAEAELGLKEKIQAAIFDGKGEEAEKLQQRLSSELQKLRTEKEEAKEKIRAAKK